jgi:hypothetical protein
MFSPRLGVKSMNAEQFKLIQLMVKNKHREIA